VRDKDLSNSFPGGRVMMDRSKSESKEIIIFPLSFPHLISFSIVETPIHLLRRTEMSMSSKYACEFLNLCLNLLEISLHGKIPA